VEQTKNQAPDLDVMYENLMAMLNAKSEYVKRVKNFIDNATTTNEVHDVLAFLRINDVISDNPEESLFGTYKLGIETYATIKIRKLQKEDKFNGLSLVQ
jgi:hypothetical protein